MKRREVSTQGFHSPRWWSGVVWPHLHAQHLWEAALRNRNQKGKKLTVPRPDGIPEMITVSKFPWTPQPQANQITLSPWNIALQKNGWTNWCLDNQRNRKIKEDWATWAAFWSPISSYSTALPRKLNWVWAGRHPCPASSKQVHFREWVHVYTLLSTEATETVKKDMLRRPVQEAASPRFLKDGCGLSMCLYSPILFQCISVADSSDCWDLFLNPSE